MRISEKLPQFEDSQSLIIVCSTQAADIYLAANGELETINNIKVENPQYSDREGHFKKRTGGEGGMTVRSGAVYEDKDKIVRDEFHKELNKALEEYKNSSDIDQVIILCSPQEKNNTKKHLPKALIEKVALEINGNYVGEHPTKILELIQEKNAVA